MASKSTESGNILQRVEDRPIAWTTDRLSNSDGLIDLTDDCRAELLATAELLEANPLPTVSLRSDDFDLPACRAMMAQAKDILENGVGFAVIDRMPVDVLGKETATKLYWLLINMLGQTVAQKWDGTLLYDVRDTGKKREAGNGVRSSTTNEGQGYHTDNSFNLPPEYVALFCLRPAMEGGVNGVISFPAAHNNMLEQHPDLLARLYEPFYFDRQQEHAPEDSPISQAPIFRYDGERLHTQFADMLVYAGYDVADVELDAKGRAAIEALSKIIEAPEARHDFVFEPGQIQIVDNRQLGHRRTAYTDWPEPDQRRHLVRLWVRNSGRPFYHG
jgi:alpha-ketoglutarate-dependent taurine dioxygenase